MPTISASDGLCVEICKEMFNRKLSLQAIANALGAMGYRSKSGITLTESHISNFLRKDLGLRKMPEHSKRYYGEFNHDVCTKAEVVGLWGFKVKVDNAEKAGEIDPREWLSVADWDRISQTGPEWVHRFHQYIVRLATT